MIVIVGLILLVASTMTCVRYAYRPRASDKSPTAEAETGDSTENSTNNTTMMTVGAETVHQGLALPGFLEVKAGAHFRLRKEIARGGMGSVWLGDGFKSELTIYGTKIIVKQNLTMQMSEREKAIFQQEVSIMHYLRTSKNIAKILGYSENPHCIIMKYYPTGSLESWLNNSVVTTRKQNHSFMIEVSMIYIDWIFLTAI